MCEIRDHNEGNDSGHGDQGRAGQRPTRVLAFTGRARIRHGLLLAKRKGFDGCSGCFAGTKNAQIQAAVLSAVVALSPYGV